MWEYIIAGIFLLLIAWLIFLAVVWIIDFIVQLVSDITSYVVVNRHWILEFGQDGAGSFGQGVTIIFSKIDGLIANISPRNKIGEEENKDG